MCAAAAEVVHLLPQDGCVQCGGNAVDEGPAPAPDGTSVAGAGASEEMASDYDFEMQVGDFDMSGWVSVLVLHTSL